MTDAPEDAPTPGLFARRIPHALAAYCAFCWGILEASSFFVERWAIPDTSLQLMIAAMVGGLPASLILTWRHGLPGAQEWTRRELVLAGLAFLLTAGLAFRFLPSRDPAPPPSPPTRGPPKPWRDLEPLRLSSGKSRVIDVNQLSRVQVDDPEVVSPIILGPHEVMLPAKASGVTTVRIWDLDGRSRLPVTVTSAP